jgi:hypothetical protein
MRITHTLNRLRTLSPLDGGEPKVGCEVVDPIRGQRIPLGRDFVSLLLRLKRDVFRDLG